MDTETMIYYSSMMSVVAVTLILFYYKSRTTKKHLPPAPPSFPVVGHLHLLKQPFHRTLQSLSQRYGPVFRLRLGYLPVLVVSSPEAVEDCLSQNDVVFANRPNILTGEIVGYDATTIVWAPYGDLWRNLRRVATLHALSSHQIQESASARTEEIRSLARKMLLAGDGSGSGGEVDLHEAFFQLMRDVVMMAVGGRRWRNGPDDEMFNSPKFLTVCDFFPVLGRIGFKRLQKQLHQVWAGRDRVAVRLLEEARKEEDRGEGRRKKAMIEEMLALQAAEPEYYTDSILKGIITLMLTAGNDTTARTMEWLMSAILNHPDILHKARAEIDARVGTARLVDDSDFPSLTYLRCVVNEGLRLFPVTPLLVPHYSSADTTVGGYHVPKGTMLLVNAWALHRDPAEWEEPLAFRRERFLNEEPCGFKFIPFGAGRRACPGSNLAMRTMVLALATLIQCFEWESLEGMDMEEHSGGEVTVGRTKNLVAICRPRASMADLLCRSK